MELQQLKYFTTVARIGKISDAAQSLFITPPALSTSISRLEKELGMPLFDRTNNRILLNQQGQIFLHYVNQIFSTLDCAKQELQQSLLHQGQHLSIASISSTTWVDLFTAFSQEYPQFTLSCTSLKRADLISGGLPAQYSFLLASDDDIPDFCTANLDSITLFTDRPVVMVPKDHPLAEKESVSLAELLNETLFLPMQDYTLHNQLVKLFAACGIPFPGGNAYSHLTSQQMVSNGLGIGFSSVHTVRSPALSIHYLPISDCVSPWPCRVYWRKDRGFTKDESVFMSFLEKHYPADAK
jgi:DNA-binding transcriptional LysR family regulator